jgi:hypothetical protein
MESILLYTQWCKSLGDTNIGTWPSKLGGVSDETVEYGYGFCVTRITE